jgi:hypothetical protein
MGEQDDNQVQGLREGEGDIQRDTGAVRATLPEKRGGKIMMMMAITTGNIVTAFLITSRRKT